MSFESLVAGAARGNRPGGYSKEAWEKLHCNEHDVKGLFADFTQSLLQYCCHSCDHPLPLEVVAETERSLIFKDPREG